jgi:hypothetical protein
MEARVPTNHQAPGTQFVNSAICFTESGLASITLNHPSNVHDMTVRKQNRNNAKAIFLI